MLRTARIPLALAALALAADLAAALAAVFLGEGGHPPLSWYVGVLLIPTAPMLGLAGAVWALAVRRHLTRRRFALALACNLAGIALAGAVLLLWPWLSSLGSAIGRSS